MSDRPPLELGFLRSTVSRGQFIGLEGHGGDDVTILTAADFNPRPFISLVDGAVPILARRSIEYRGQVLGLVLAPSRSSLFAALDAITVQQKSRLPVEVMDEGGERVAKLGGFGNVLARRSFSKGDLDAALKTAPHDLNLHFTFGAQEGYDLKLIEVMARLVGDGVEISASFRDPGRAQRLLADVLALEVDQVHLRSNGFRSDLSGDEAWIAAAASVALAARKSERSVRYTQSRSEAMSFGPKRPAAEIALRLGFDDSGRILALSTDLRLDGGAYSLDASRLLRGAQFATCGPYALDNVKFSGRVFATNFVPACGACQRGQSSVSFALERGIDAVAKVLDLSPIEVRRRNLIEGRSLRDPLGRDLRFLESPRELIDRVESDGGADAPLSLWLDSDLEADRDASYVLGVRARDQRRSLRLSFPGLCLSKGERLIVRRRLADELSIDEKSVACTGLLEQFHAQDNDHQKVHAIVDAVVGRLGSAREHVHGRIPIDEFHKSEHVARVSAAQVELSIDRLRAQVVLREVALYGAGAEPTGVARRDLGVRLRLATEGVLGSEVIVEYGAVCDAGVRPLTRDEIPVLQMKCRQVDDGITEPEWGLGGLRSVVTAEIEKSFGATLQMQPITPESIVEAGRYRR